MNLRKLPRGKKEECFGVLGLGTGSLCESSPEEIEAVVCKAIANGINFFDLCAGGSCVYEPFGKAIQNNREQVYFQLHFGAVYNEKGEYGWSRDLETVKKTFEWELSMLGTDYADFGFLHCVDEESDWEELQISGIYAYLKEMKRLGKVHYLGFSSHTPSVAHKLLDTGLMDMMMFSINPAYDLERGDEYGIGSTHERAELFRRCQREGVGISVMKPFHGGKLLDAKTSPFRQEMSRYQCMQYALDRPGVLTVVPGVRNMHDLDELLGFIQATEEEKDYSLIGQFTPETALGNCVYCNHCQPCPAGIDIGIVNKYYDLALVGDKIAENHYSKLDIKASACLSCGHCDKRCPFGVKQQEKMKIIQVYFGE